MADARREIIIDAQIRTGDSAEEVKGVGDSIEETSSSVRGMSKDVDSVEKEIKSLEREMEKLSKAGKKNTAEFKKLEEAHKEAIATQKKLSGDMEHLGGEILVEVTGSISKMEDKLYDMALAGQQNTQEFKDLQEQTARYRQIIIETDRSVDALAEQGRGLSTALTISEGVAAGYGAFQSVLALTGSESEELEKSLQKLIAVQTLLNSINVLRNQVLKDGNLLSAVRNIQTKVQTAALNAQTAAQTTNNVATKAAAIAMRALNAVMALNPAFLLAGAVAALTGAYLLLTAETDEARTSQELMNEASERAVEKAAEEVNALEALDSRLKANSGNRDEQIAAIKDLQEQYPGLLTNIDAERASTEEVNRAIEEYTELSKLRAELEALNEIRLEATKQAMQAQTDAVTGNNESWSSWAISITDANLAEEVHLAQQDEIISKSEEEKRTIDELTQGIEDRIAAKEKELGIDRKSREEAERAKEEAEEREKRAEEARKKAAQAAEEEAKRLEQMRIERAKKEADDLAALLLEIEELQNEHLDKRLSQEERELNAVRDKYFAIIEAAKEAGQDTALLMEAQAEEEDAIRQRFLKERLAKESDLIQREKKAMLDLDLLIAEQNSQAMVEAQKEIWEFERDALLANTELTESERLLIIEQFRQKEAELEKKMAEESKKTQKERFEFGLNAAKDSFDTLGSLAEAFAGDSEQAQRRAFNIQKAASLASALIQTYQGAQAAFTSQFIAGDPTSIVRAVIAAGVATAAGLANVAKIARTKFQASESGGGGGAAAAGGGGSSFNFQQGIVNASPQAELFGEGFSGSEIFAGGQPQDQDKQFNVNVTADVVETEFTAMQNEAAASDEFLKLN